MNLSRLIYRANVYLFSRPAAILKHKKKPPAGKSNVIRGFELDDIFTCIDSLKHGDGHGPNDPYFYFFSIVMGLGFGWLGHYTGAVYAFTNVLGHHAAPVEFLVLFVITVVSSVVIYKALQRIRLEQPSWAQTIENILNAYQPINVEAYLQIIARSKAAGGVTYSQVFEWIKIERIAIATTREKGFIPFPQARD